MIVALIVTYFVKKSKKKETTIDTQDKSVNDGETQSDDSGVADTLKRDETSTFNNEVEQDLPSFHPSILCDEDGSGDDPQGGIVFVPSKDEDVEMLPNTP